ncbi:metallophosphoesterase [Candidatus Lokiarchaeum ossiferum]|uniref:metallophosphoesterase n=1 Tax=Candidatus Lokiarchaeum ossiferum TaxID=2951803 RepID=UPI00352F703E
MVSPSNTISRYSDASLVVAPQIGHPTMIKNSYQKIAKERSFRVELWIAAGKTNTVRGLTEEISNNLNVYPLLGLEKKTLQSKRGRILSVCPLEITEKKFKRLKDPTILDDFLSPSSDDQISGLGSEPIHRLIYDLDIFPERAYLYRCLCQVDLSDECIAYLEHNNFLLFDLVQTFTDLPQEIRELPHSICLNMRNSWNDLNFIQISDLHVSRRNDYFLGMIKHNLRTSALKSINNLYNKTLKPLIDKISSSEKPLARNFKENSLENRLINPNNNLRLFIKKANKLACEKKLDFIVMTGDLVDFCTSAENHLSSLPEYRSFINYEDSNWVRFLDILLNRPLPPQNFNYLGIEPSEELLVPIYTLPGNHDWRISHYNIQSIGIFKKLGLSRVEAMNYREPPATSPLSVGKKALMPYFQYINPFLDYFIKLGDHTFTFLDSGPESIAEIKFLLMADPSTTGFSTEQLEYLSLIAKKFIKNESSELSESNGIHFLLSHAPIVNPSKKKVMKIKFLQSLNLLPKFRLDDFKASKLYELGENDPRSDIDLEYRSGTISQNWVNTMGVLERNNLIHLAGHTHKWREFRLKRSDRPTKSTTGYGKMILNPFAIYWDDYTKLYGKTNPSFFEENRPFLLQAPSLGIQNKELGLPAGGYRTFCIRNNKIHQVRMDFVGKILSVENSLHKDRTNSNDNQSK